MTCNQRPNPARTRALAALLTTLALWTAPAVAADPGGGDAAGNPSNADTLPPGTYTNGNIASSSDADWYRLTVPALTQVTFEITPKCNTDTDDFDLTLFEGDGTTKIDASTNAACQSDTVTCVANDNQVLYARVTTPTGDTGGYTITVSEALALPAPLGSTPACTLPP